MSIDYYTTKKSFYISFLGAITNYLCYESILYAYTDETKKWEVFNSPIKLRVMEEKYFIHSN